ncbi:hypothetical protein ATN38_17700 [Rhodococcus sp. FH8]|uniref:hypothetical protein n=1 Tax=Rhodococcus TaxID=1827 RepID=UPI0006423946|nr:MULTISPECIES: hypothetical protein [Rhodococcus]KLN73174.1 hypothetical protein ABM90_03055 [Rhodococcus erythropolis]MBT2274687.1 hypothetical protein [Rhodococcus qingshengii]MBW0285061.1 hypothetical protein [Rhodococcus sp. FH8]
MGHSRTWLTRALAMPVAVAVTLLLPLGSVASAQDFEDDADTSVAAAATTPISFTELGRGTDIVFSSDDAPVLVTVPVPDGLTATAVTGILTAPTDFSRGWLEVTADGRLVSRVDFDAGQAGTGLPISVPLQGLEVVDRSVTVSMIAHLVPVDDRCYDRTRYQPLALRDAFVTYDGAEQQPTTVATFFPPILRKATIYVTDGSSRSQQSAALQLSAAIVNKYGSQPDAVVVEQLPNGQSLPSVEPGLFERAVVLGNSGDAGIDLATAPNGAPVLRISGDDKTLVPQVSLLAANFDGYWAASRALASPDNTVAQISQDAITVGELKLGTMTASGLNHIEVDVPFSQSQLGRPMKDVSIRMIGSYVPLPNSRNGELSISLGDSRLASQTVNETGRFDIGVDVPNELLRRDLTFEVSMDVTGDFQCGTSSPSSLTVDPASTITSTTGFPPTPGGFQALPQSMLPTLDVGLSHGDFADLVRAQRLVVAMQRLSYLPLQPRVLPFGDAATSSLPALLIAADGTLPTPVALPMDTADQGLLRLQGLEFGGQYGALQVVSGSHNEVVALTSEGDAADADGLLNWLESGKDRFAELTGDLLVAPRGGEPFDVGVNVAPLGTATSAEEETGLSAVTIGWIGFGTVVLIAVAVGGVLVARRRGQ